MLMLQKIQFVFEKKFFIKCELFDQLILQEN
jgi:hypothetical protein